MKLLLCYVFLGLLFLCACTLNLSQQPGSLVGSVTTTGGGVGAGMGVATGASSPAISTTSMRLASCCVPTAREKERGEEEEEERREGGKWERGIKGAIKYSFYTDSFHM